MKPYFQDKHIRLFNKDCRSMDELDDESVQMCVTSPPYFGLRKYSGEQELVWGGDKDCKHQWGVATPKKFNTIQGGAAQRPHNFIMEQNYTQGNICSLCGAWKGSYGLEPTPELYVSHTIEILREIRRVMRKDGVVFWNIGDSYYGAKGGGGIGDKHGEQLKNFKKEGFSIKPKDLCLIPFRVAIAAQDDGWWVRSVIIWSKNNPMPESVTDRPTTSHEYILMLTKSSRYFWDAEAVREKAHSETWGVTKNGDYFGEDTKDYDLAGVQSPSDIKRRIGAKVRGMKRKGRGSNDPELGNRNFMPIQQEQHHGQDIIDGVGRNIRTVWEFSSQPYPKAHFATFPEKLPELCIKAATPEVGCCSKCGAPWERVVAKREYPPEVFTKARRPDDKLVRSSPMADGKGSGSKMQKWLDENPLKTLGWKPACKCNAEKTQSTILDPFSGSGTSLWVAKKLNRKSVGYEISLDYCQLAVERCRQGAMDLTL